MSDAPPIPTAASIGPPDPATARPATPAGRRRLWQLPRDVQECLLLWAFSPERLRQVAERAVGRLRGRPVALCGSAADLLACVLHDLDRRNAVSEAVHDALAAHFAPVASRWKGRADPELQAAAWREAPALDRPALLWAWLTAPGGNLREAHWMTEARLAWADDARRAAAEAARAVAAEARCLALEQALLEARARAAQRADELERARHAAAQETARLRGESDRWRLRAQSLEPPAGSVGTDRSSVARPRRLGASSGRNGEPSAVIAPPRDDGAAAVTVSPRSASWTAVGPAEGVPTERHPPGPGSPWRGPALPALEGRRVLCVGGMPGAHRRYQAVVEGAGARFAFHDGGVEHGVDRLARQLAAADVVVCQSGCLNHEAYQRVKRHCQRAGTPCLYVERPSLTQFVRTLGLVPAPEGRSA